VLKQVGIWNQEQQPVADTTFRRILLKLSGEALMSDDQQFGHGRLGALADAVAETVGAGVQVGIVVGAGNIFRARSANLDVVQRVTADQVGMLGTVMNGAVVRDYLRVAGLAAQVFTPREIQPLSTAFRRDDAVSLLARGGVAIFAGGTGNPYFTTDSAAALRALEIDADVLVKGTQVDGVYDRDPHEFADAVRFDTLTHREAVERQLKVMDLTAFTLCAEQALPILVFDIGNPNNLVELVRGAPLGTWIRTPVSSAEA